MSFERLGFDHRPLTWLGDERGPSAVLVASIWRGFPFVMLMTLAGLQAVAAEQYEAAAVDGAGRSSASFRDAAQPSVHPRCRAHAGHDLDVPLLRSGPGHEAGGLVGDEVLAVLVYGFAFSTSTWAWRPPPPCSCSSFCWSLARVRRLMLREQRGAT